MDALTNEGKTRPILWEPTNYEGKTGTGLQNGRPARLKTEWSTYDEETITMAQRAQEPCASNVEVTVRLVVVSWKRKRSSQQSRMDVWIHSLHLF